MVKLTPTQQRIFDRLSDGEAHTACELHRLLNDYVDDPQFLKSMEVNLQNHITRLRKLLTSGLDIMSRGYNGKTTYRLVRHISKGE